MLIDPAMLVKYAIPIAASTLVLLLGKPFFVTLGAIASGQPLKIAVQSGMSLSQIGEFSFIIAGLGLSLKVTGDFLYPVAVAVSVITTFTTPYMIRLSEPVFKYLDKILSPKIRNSLIRYSAGAQHINEMSDWRKVLSSYFTNVVVFSVIIITLILISTQYFAPLFSEHGWQKFNLAVITLCSLSPFIWALAFRRTQRESFAKVWLNTDKRGPLLLLQLSRIVLAVAYIGLFLFQLFSPVVAFWSVIVVCMVIVLFSRRIKAFYSKIEMRFMTNYHERDSGTINSAEILTPWDSHIAQFELDAHSPYVGKTLEQTRMREDFGVNIVVIERGNFVITIPKRENHLYPNDRISVIGTDEQLNNFRLFLESAEIKNEKEEVNQNVTLQHFTLGKNATLAGQSIRSSKIREHSEGLVVGVERNGQRILNPESDFVFEMGDIVWLVGNEKRIRIITNELEIQNRPMLTV
jgi:CPA2 family monovalent cation:H+ antiporter-2